MFDFLKKKLAGALNAFTGKKEESKQEKQETTPESETTPAQAVEARREEERPSQGKETDSIRAELGKALEEAKAAHEKPPARAGQEKPPAPVTEFQVLEKPKPRPQARQKEEKAQPAPVIPKKQPKLEITENREEPKPMEVVAPANGKSVRELKKKYEEEAGKKSKVKVGLLGKVKQAVIGKSRFTDSEVEEFAWNIEMLLLESDVEMEAASAISSRLKEEMKALEYSRSEDPRNVARNALRGVLKKSMTDSDFDLLEAGKGKKPFTVLFLGPNGAGKTTTIARVTRLLQKNQLSVVWAAADTFRAGSIQQLEEHARKLGSVRVVKHSYGADPAAVAFDAIAAAKSKGADFVLIDSAGRQETNYNLMEEMKKLVRVSKPDLKVFVGEALAGHALVEQVRQFQESVGVDGVILTKIDADAKGGGAISILSRLGIPILYVGVGQGYDDLQKFEPSLIIDNILGPQAGEAA